MAGIYGKDCWKSGLRSIRPFLSAKSLGFASLVLAFSLSGPNAQAASLTSGLIEQAYALTPGVTTGDTVAIILQDQYAVKFEDANPGGGVNPGDLFQAIFQIDQLASGGVFDPLLDDIESVTPKTGSLSVNYGLYAIAEFVLGAGSNELDFTAASGTVSIYEFLNPLPGIGFSFTSESAAIELAGGTPIAVAGFGGDPDSSYDALVTPPDQVDLDISLVFESLNMFLPAGFTPADNNLGTEIFGTLATNTNITIIGADPFADSYFAIGNGDFAITVVPSPAACGIGMLGALGLLQRKKRSVA